MALPSDPMNTSQLDLNQKEMIAAAAATVSHQTENSENDSEFQSPRRISKEEEEHRGDGTTADENSEKNSVFIGTNSVLPFLENRTSSTNIDNLLSPIQHQIVPSQASSISKSDFATSSSMLLRQQESVTQDEQNEYRQDKNCALSNTTLSEDKNMACSTSSLFASNTSGSNTSLVLPGVELDQQLSCPMQQEDESLVGVHILHGFTVSCPNSLSRAGKSCSTDPDLAVVDNEISTYKVAESSDTTVTTRSISPDSSSYETSFLMVNGKKCNVTDSSTAHVATPRQEAIAEDETKKGATSESKLYGLMSPPKTRLSEDVVYITQDCTQEQKSHQRPSSSIPPTGRKKGNSDHYDHTETAIRARGRSVYRNISDERRDSVSRRSRIRDPSPLHERLASQETRSSALKRTHKKSQSETSGRIFYTYIHSGNDLASNSFDCSSTNPKQRSRHSSSAPRSTRSSSTSPRRTLHSRGAQQELSLQHSHSFGHLEGVPSAISTSNKWIQVRNPTPTRPFRSSSHQMRDDVSDISDNDIKFQANNSYNNFGWYNDKTILSRPTSPTFSSVLPSGRKYVQYFDNEKLQQRNKDLEDKHNSLYYRLAKQETIASSKMKLNSHNKDSLTLLSPYERRMLAEEMALKYTRRQKSNARAQSKERVFERLINHANEAALKNKKSWQCDHNSSSTSRTSRSTARYCKSE